MIGDSSPLYRANLDLVRAEQLLREGRRVDALPILVPHAELGTLTRIRSNAGFNAAGRWHLAMADALRGSGDDRVADSHRAKGLQLTAAIVGERSPYLARLRQRFALPANTGEKKPGLAEPNSVHTTPTLMVNTN